MSDESQNTQMESQESPSTQTQNSEHMIPKSRFDEVNNRAKELQSRLEALELAQKEKESKELAEQNRFKELYEKAQAELQAKTQADERAQRYQAALQATNEARINQVPEDKRSLIPEYDDPVKLGAWLDANLSLLTSQAKPQAPNLNGGSGGTGSDAAKALPSNIQAVTDLAQQLGYKVNPERIAEFAKQQPKPTTGD